MNFKSIFFILATTVLFASCNNPSSNNKRSDKNGTLMLADITAIGTLFPHSATSLTEYIIISQIHESLLRLDPKTLEVMPALAEKWETSADGKTITFHLAKGVHFHDDDCFSGNNSEVTAKDVKFSLELLCSKDEKNLMYEILMKNRIEGGDDFYNKKASSIRGFKLIDDYTFSITLTSPSLSFLKILAHPSTSIVSEAAYKTYGNDLKVGAGPFVYQNASTAEKFILARNNNYYAKDETGNSLPYLDTVVMNILPSIEDVLSFYENKKVDLVNTIPSAKVREIVEQNIKEFSAKPPKSLLKHEAEMKTQFYTFNTQLKPFDNVTVRQAISYAIDKEKIVAEILQGQAMSAGNYGITPNTFAGYDTKNIKGYTFDVQKAKELLAQAGYPNGKGFPDVKLLINTGSSRNSNVLFEIQKQLKENLNINLSFDALPYSKKQDLQMHGQANIFRDGWTADYSSPESFLSLFYGKSVPENPNDISYPNTARYQNTVYDDYFVKGRTASIKDSSYAYFMKAEQVLMNDAAIIPLWYEGTYRLLNNKVKNLELNPMSYYDVRRVYKEK